MSSREVRIIDNGTSFTVTTGENVVIGHSEFYSYSDAEDLAWEFMRVRMRGGTQPLSDSALVAYLVENGLLPARTPDEG